MEEKSDGKGVLKNDGKRSSTRAAYLEIHFENLSVNKIGDPEHILELMHVNR
jgi:hypothetical protein